MKILLFFTLSQTLMLGAEMDFSEKDTIIHNALYLIPSWATVFNTL